MKRKTEARPCITKITSIINMRYAIFNSNGPVVQVPCPFGKPFSGRVHKNFVLKVRKVSLQEASKQGVVRGLRVRMLRLSGRLRPR